MDYQLISEQSALDDYLATLAQGPLALDTEFVRTRTYYPQLGLLQVFDGHQLALIDPLSLDLSGLWARLRAPEQVVILHAASEDLELIVHQAGHLPSIMHDTQLACAFLGHGVSMGFGALVQTFMGVELAKDQARTDWLARPLTPRQLDYAAADVFYLLPIYHKLLKQLRESDKLAWFAEECQRHCARKLRTADPARAYLDIGNAWQLTPPQLAILRELAAWRLGEAQRRDLALNFVVKELHLFKIAEAAPKTLRDLQLLDLLPIEIKIHGKRLLDIVAQAQALPASTHPALVRRLVDFPRYKSELKRVKALVDAQATQQQLPPELIASKKIIHQYFTWSWCLSADERAVAERPSLLQGWRQQLVGHQLEQH
ncbi:MAG: ribonuclease D [Aeromonas sp.]